MKPFRDNWLQYVVAAILLVAATVFFVHLVREVDEASEAEWARLAYLFGAVEAITFTIVGWLFGREVHREQAAAATEDKQDAIAKKETAEHDLAEVQQRAGQLVGAVQAVAASQRAAAPDGEELLSGGASADATVEADQLAYLGRLAAELFPRNSL